MSNRMAVVSVYQMLRQGKGMWAIIRDLKRQGLTCDDRNKVIQEAFGWQDMLCAVDVLR